MRRITSFFLALALLLGLSSCTLPEPEESSQNLTSTAALTDTLQVDFLDVGQADSALVRCGDAAMLIDGGNAADSSYVVSFLQSENVEHLDYLVASHAHEDHAGGLSGPLNTVTVDHVYCPVDTAEGKYFASLQKYTAAQGLSIEIPAVGDVWQLGQATVTVLGPVTTYSDANNMSLVLRVEFGDTSFLFTGDMEAQAEEDLLNSGADVSATVLKVGHHGSDTSTTQAFLQAVNPSFAVISVSADNSYGHPSQTVLDRLAAQGAALYITRDLGNITAISDGTTVTFRQSPAVVDSEVSDQDSAQEAAEVTYIGNKNSKVFHKSTCANLPKAENQVPLSSRQAALDAGYSPCGNCEP
jgi:competence protein ComEC